MLLILHSSFIIYEQYVIIIEIGDGRIFSKKQRDVLAPTRMGKGEALKTKYLRWVMGFDSYRQSKGVAD